MDETLWEILEKVFRKIIRQSSVIGTMVVLILYVTNPLIGSAHPLLVTNPLIGCAHPLCHKPELIGSAHPLCHKPSDR